MGAGGVARAISPGRINAAPKTAPRKKEPLLRFAIVVAFRTESVCRAEESLKFASLARMPSSGLAGLIRETGIRMRCFGDVSELGIFTSRLDCQARDALKSHASGRRSAVSGPIGARRRK
jgi:hypothetical protein